MQALFDLQRSQPRSTRAMTSTPGASEKNDPEPYRLRGERIVCFSTADWDTLLPTNKHQLMRRFARHNRVLFVETLGTRAPRLASGTDLSRIGRRLRRGFEGATQRAPTLWTLSPVVRPAWGTAAARAANRVAFRAQASRALSQFPDPIVWVYSPYAVHLLEGLRPRLVVYHMVDDLSEVPGVDARALREAETQLLARADCVFCTERGLFDRAQRINGGARFMPNVGDYRHFRKPRADVADERLAALRALSRPRIVFSGNLAPHKVHFDLIARIARERPQWQFVLIGPPWEGTEEPSALRALRRARNVTFTGHVAYRDLPAFLHEADVLAIPYRENRATRAVSPMKFFEYLATGLPVVATPLPSLLPYHEAVHLARTPAQWVRAIEAALADPADLAEQRRVLARRHTWQARIAEMEREIGDALGETRGE